MEPPLAIKGGFGWVKEAAGQLIDVIGVVTDPKALSIDVFGI